MASRDDSAACGIVTLITDFGTVDGYVGAVKGVILSVAHELRVVDVTHDIPPGDVRAAAWALRVAAPLFPPATVHLVVVDPGVGSSRRPVAVGRAGAMFVGPDNGVFGLVSGELGWARLLEPARLPDAGSNSFTFHGRDIFAPAAAALASGAPPESLGPPLDPRSLVELGLDEGWADAGDEARGTVLHVDRFGNLVTSLPSTLCSRAGDGRAGARAVRSPVKSYEAMDEDAASFIAGSSGLLEISVRNGSASRLLGIGVGAPVTVRLTQPRRVEA